MTNRLLFFLLISANCFIDREILSATTFTISTTSIPPIKMTEYITASDPTKLVFYHFRSTSTVDLTVYDHVTHSMSPMESCSNVNVTGSFDGDSVAYAHTSTMYYIRKINDTHRVFVKKFNPDRLICVEQSTVNFTSEWDYFFLFPSGTKVYVTTVISGSMSIQECDSHLTGCSTKFTFSSIGGFSLHSSRQTYKGYANENRYAAQQKHAMCVYTVTTPPDYRVFCGMFLHDFNYANTAAMTADFSLLDAFDKDFRDITLAFPNPDTCVVIYEDNNWDFTIQFIKSNGTIINKITTAFTVDYAVFGQIDNLDPSVVYFQCDYGETLSIQLNATSDAYVSDSLEDYGDYHFKFFHRFSATESVTYFTKYGPDEAAMGVSFTTNPYSSAEGVNSALANLNTNKPVEMSSTKYFSINDVVGFTNFGNYRVTKTFEVVTSATAQTDFYYWVGSIRQYTAACPANLPSYIQYLNGDKECTDQCDSTHHVLLGTNICFESTCTAHGAYYFVYSTASKQCDTACKSGYGFLDGSVCKTTCPAFVKGLTNLFNNTTETGVCLGTCYAAKFRLSISAFTYTDASQKSYCLDSCSHATYNKYYIVSSVNYCTETCLSESSATPIPSTHRYSNGSECALKCPGSAEYIDSVTNFNLTTEYGTCQSTCNTPNYVLESGTYTYSDTTVKKYCLSICDKATYTKYYVSGGQQICVDDCRNESTALTVPANNRYTLDHGLGVVECALKCPGSAEYIDSVTNFNLTTEYGTCQSTCNTPNYILESGTYTYSDTTVKKYCLSICDKATFTKYYVSGGQQICVDDCRNESTALTVPANNRYTLDHGLGVVECVVSCPSTFVSVTNWNTGTEYGTCKTGCLTTEYRLSVPTITFSDASAKVYCLSICDKATYTNHYTDSSVNYCTDNCRAETATISMHAGYRYSLTSGGNDYCVAKCPTSDKYISSVNNWNTVNEYATCSSTCSTTKYNLVHSSLVYTDTSAKDYCLDLCNQGTFVYFYISGGNKYCSSSCTAAAGVPANLRYYYDDGSGNLECVEKCPGSKPYLASVSNWNTATESATCQTNCTQYILSSSTFQYPDTSIKSYCLTDCTLPSYQFYYTVSTLKYCTDTCTSSVTSVPATHRYIYEHSVTQKECVLKCSGALTFIENVSNYNASTETGSCKAGCAAGSGYILRDASLTYSDSSAKEYCLPNCNITGFDKIFIEYVGVTPTFKHCVNSCDPQVASHSLTPSKPFAIANSEPQPECVDTCPNYYDVDNSVEIGTANNTGVCVSTCGADKYLNFPSSSAFWYCVPTCFSPYIYHYIDTSNSHHICVSGCPGGYPYLDPAINRCLVSCTPTYPFESAGNICLLTCAPPMVADNTLCTTNCSSDKPHFELVSGVNYCRYICSSFISLSLNSPIPLSTSLPSDSNTECISTCTGFKLQNQGQYAYNSSPKHYCLNVCPSDLYSLEISPTDKSCLTNCDPESTHKYATPTRKCVNSCENEGFNFYMEDLTCSDSCSLFIYRDIFCVSVCPLDTPLKEGNQCVKKCSEAAPFMLDFEFCVPSCPEYSYDNICTSQCDSEEIKTYYASNLIPYTDKLFKLNSGECSDTCSEANFQKINSRTLECISNCPPCENCDASDLKYKDSLNYCRNTCDDPKFPFKDEILAECLSECNEERPYSVNMTCKSTCPPDYPLAAKKPKCNKCENCDDFALHCSKTCPVESPYQMKTSDKTFCTCECPVFFEPEGRTCKLKCKGEFGLIPNNSLTGCIHCFKDEDSFYFEGKCVEYCPKGTTNNQHFACIPCIQANLWTNEEGKCIPLSKCNPLSYFDYDNQLCTKCDKKGFLLVKRPFSVIACEKSDCTDGHLSQIKNQKFCTICLPGQFFEEPNCTDNCSNSLEYNFSLYTCDNCLSDCGCCLNGKCKHNKCICEDGFEGKKCNISKIETTDKLSEMVNFLYFRMIKALLIPNENKVIEEIAILYKSERNSRQLDVTNTTILRFIKNIESYLYRNYIKYAYQTTILGTIDFYLDLTLDYFQRTGNKAYLDSAVLFLYDLTHNIQLFNVTLSIIPEFTVVTHGIYSGYSFSFSFGSDVEEDKNIDLSKCLVRIRENLKLGKEYKFPYKLLSFSQYSNLVLNPLAFKVSDSPLVLLTLYDSSGAINIASNCEEQYIDVKFEANLTQSQADTVFQFLKTPFNIFSKEDKLFNDKCVSLGGETDSTLKMRKEQYFIDPAEICNESSKQVCSIESVNDLTVECDCKGIKDKRKSSLTQLFSYYPQNNYPLLFCWNVFVEADLLQNRGFFLILLPSLIILVFTIWSTCSTNEKLLSEGRFEYIRQDLLLYDPETMKKSVYFDECYKLKGYLTRFSKNSRLKHSRNKISFMMFKSLPTINDLELLSAEDSLILDSRSNFRFAMDTLAREHSLFEVFTGESLVNPKPFVALLYLSELNLGVAFNCFFIEDELVENFAETEDHSLFHSFERELSKTFWAILTVKVVKFFINMFYSISLKRRRHLLRRMLFNDNFYLRKAFDSFMRHHRIKLTFFVGISAVFNGFCLYLVTIYTELHQSSYVIWLNGVIMGLILDNFVFQMFVPASLILSRILGKWKPQFRGLVQLAYTLKGLNNLQLY